MAPKRNSLQQASLSLLLSLLSPRMQPPFLLLPTHRCKARNEVVLRGRSRRRRRCCQPCHDCREVRTASPKPPLWLSSRLLPSSASSPTTSWWWSSPASSVRWRQWWWLLLLRLLKRLLLSLFQPPNPQTVSRLIQGDSFFNKGTCQHFISTSVTTKYIEVGHVK